MSDAILVQVSFEIFAALVHIFCIQALFFGRKITKRHPPESRRRNMLSVLLFSVVCVMLSDACGYIFEYNATRFSFYLVRICNFLLFLFTEFLSVIASEYIFACGAKPEDQQQVRRLRMLAHFLGIAALLFLIVSQFYDLIYYFDGANRYHRGPYYWVFAGIEFLMLVVMMVCVHRFRRNMTKYEVASMITFIALPMVTNIIQTFIYGIALNNAAIFVSTTLVFLVYEIEKTDRLAAQTMLAMEQRTKLAEMNNRIAVSQIQPHFIFNVLSSIERLCRIDPSRAEQATRYLATYLRSDLNVLGAQTNVDFSEELKLIRAYIWLEKMRFGDDFDFREDIRVSQFTLPLMTVQPIVENAVKHAMRDDAQLHIVLRTEEAPDAYIITVLDDGVGFNPEEEVHDNRIHVGLENVRNRVTSFRNGCMQLDSVSGQGTTVTLRFPK